MSQHPVYEWQRPDVEKNRVYKRRFLIDIKFTTYRKTFKRHCIQI